MLDCCLSRLNFKVLFFKIIIFLGFYLWGQTNATAEKKKQKSRSTNPTLCCLRREMWLHFRLVGSWLVRQPCRKEGEGPVRAMRQLPGRVQHNALSVQEKAQLAP